VVWFRESSFGQGFEAGGDPFEVVGIEVKAEIVLIQYYDGAVDEVDFDAWLELDARPAAPPSSMDGALDAERSDFGLDDYGSSGPRGQDAVGWLDSHGY